MSRLNSLREEIPRLRRQIQALKEDTKFIADGGTIHYSCDFSELYDYLTGSDSKDPAVNTVGPLLYDDSRAAQTAGLVSFFNSINKRPILLLRPHAKELWGFVRNQRQNRKDATRLHGSFLEKLTDEAKTIVLDFANNPNDSTDLEGLLPTIKDEAEELCMSIAELIEKTVPSDVLERLSDLINSKKLVHELTNIMKNAGVAVPSTELITEKDTLRILERFPEHTRERSRINKINDCRALLHLRDINRVLMPKNHKIVFLTRDRNLHHIAYDLRDESWFSWQDAYKFIRTMTGLQYDLQLAALPSQKKKIDLLEEADQLFADVEQAVQENSRSGKTALGTAIKNLRHHLALRLSLSLQVIWRKREHATSHYRDSRTEIGLDESFTKLLSSKQYRDLVTLGVEESFNELEAQALYSFLKEHLHDTEAQIAIEFIEGREAGVSSIALVQSETTPSIRFASDELTKILNDLNSVAGENDQMRAKLEAAIGRIVLTEPDAEDFLFMAFVFCLSKLWQPALRLARRSAALKDKRLSCETHYLMAFVQRRLARQSADNIAVLLNEAFKSIRLAITNSGERLDDARLALEFGTICLAYHSYSKNAGRPIRSNAQPLVLENAFKAERPAEIIPETAIAILRHALSNAGQHLWLRLSIMNNLAYTAVLDFPMPLDEARKYCVDIRQIFADLSAQPRKGLPTEPWPGILQTLIMVDAKVAFEHRETGKLKLCRENLQEIAERTRISNADRSACEKGVEKVKQWLDDIA